MHSTREPRPATGAGHAGFVPSVEATRTAILLLLAFLLVLADRVVYWLPRDLLSDGLDAWVLSGWLIDYSAGFVRRGLSGEIIGTLTGLMPARVAVGLVAWGLFLAVTAGYVRLVLRARRTLSTLALLGLLFLPTLLPFYLWDHAALGRKELLGFLLVLWHLLILERCFPMAGPAKGGRYLRRLWPISMLGLPLLGLLHEGTVLWFGPTHALLTLLVLRRGTDAGWLRALGTTTLLYLLPALVLLGVFAFGRATPDDAARICSGWETLGALGPGACDDTLDARMSLHAPAIGALGWSVQYAVEVAANALPPKAIVIWLIALPLLAFATLAVGGMASHSIAAGRPSERFLDWLSPPAAPIAALFFLLPLLLPAPIYIIAHDYGRWLALVGINYVMISLSPEVVALLVRRRAPAPAAASTTLARTRGYWLGFTGKALFLLLCITALRLPHCCAGFHILAPSVRTAVENVLALLGSR